MPYFPFAFIRRFRFDSIRLVLRFGYCRCSLTFLDGADNDNRLFILKPCVR
jgi:hypothetical protein